MNPDEILRIVEQIHLEKKIDREIVFIGIEQALVIAARKHNTETANVIVHVDRQTGEISAYRDNIPMTTSEIAERIGAQTAKQVMIQKIREAERDAIYDEYYAQIGEMITGLFHHNESAGTIVSLSNVEALLPKSEKIPGDSFQGGDRIHAVIVEVRKNGTKVKVILSRMRPIFLERLFEQEVPEIAEGVIEIKAVSREAGYRSKIAVACSDPRIDAVGACIGLRRSRIRNIMDEIGGERVDVVAWDDDMYTFIPQSLLPANVDDVILCQLLGRAIVLVKKDQRSLAIGRKGQNVRLASRLCDWDIDIMTREELDESIERATENFSKIDGMSEDLIDRLVPNGFFSYDDLSIIEPDDLMEMGNLTEEEAAHIVLQADKFAEEEELNPPPVRAPKEKANTAKKENMDDSESDSEPVKTETENADAATGVMANAVEKGSDSSAEENAAEEAGSSSKGADGEEVPVDKKTDGNAPSVNSSEDTVM